MGRVSTVRKLAPGAFLLAVFLLAGYPHAVAQEIPQSHVFFGSTCDDCPPYVKDVFLPALAAQGWQGKVLIHDFMTPEGRGALLAEATRVGLPREASSYWFAFVPLRGATLVLLGHPPRGLIEQALSLQRAPVRLYINQPQMHGEPSTYQIWTFQGEPMEFPITTPLREALARLEQRDASKPVSSPSRSSTLLLPTVLAAGLLDGLNPCAFAVILLLLAFLFTIRKPRLEVLKLGGAYISVIFLVYLLIGLGLLRLTVFSRDAHLLAKLGAGLVILLGLVNLKDSFFPNLPVHLSMPAFAHVWVDRLLRRATLPATLLVGALVGLCTFPCAGGVYVSITTLLAAKATQAKAVGYLVLYNLMFVAPLVAIVLFVGNRITAKTWAMWERTHARALRLWYGVAMIALGLVLLGWVI
ncbi:MAG: cytochrome c biogenesis protein CcdA [Armatimonadota bacterium]|nr:cytochrome c biogenesis protein CcdA [Armatimonadota bacterium]